MPTLRRGGLVLVLLLAAHAAACDTDDPLTVSSQTVELWVAASNATTSLYDVWEVYQDNANDGPDDIDGDGAADVSLFCQLAGRAGPSRFPGTSGSRSGHLPRRSYDSPHHVDAGVHGHVAQPSPVRLSLPARQPGQFIGNPRRNPSLGAGITPPIDIDDAARRGPSASAIRSALRDPSSIVTALTNPVHELRPTFSTGCVRGPGFRREDCPAKR